MAFPSDLTRTKNWGTEVLTDTDLEGQLDLIINWVMAAVNSSTGHDHSGTANKSKPISPATGLVIASQAQGDVLYASSASAWARLGAGTNGQCLTTAGAAANPTFAGMTTQGDVEYHNGTTRARLAAGTAEYPLVTKGAGANPAFQQLATAGIADGAVTCAKSSALLGAWADKSSDYGAQEAATDGLVIIYNEGGGDRQHYGFSDANSDPTTVRAAFSTYPDGGTNQTAMFPVRKGDYWKVTITGGTGTLKVYWIPLGA